MLIRYKTQTIGHAKPLQPAIIKINNNDNKVKTEILLYISGLAGIRSK